MSQFEYTPDKEQKVHQDGAIRLICSPYQSHENGLPEWLKNSADAYAREDTPSDERVIVVILDDAHSGVPASISCLDLVGMTSADIEEHFRHWASPDAASRGGLSSGVQGGHGNGGKCYMTQMFEDFSYVYTVRKGRGNRYGVAAHSVRFGYIPSHAEGRDFEVKDVWSELATALDSVRCTPDVIQSLAAEGLETLGGFTLVRGVGPRDYRKRFNVRRVVDHLSAHVQMIRTLEVCLVYVVVNGNPVDKGQRVRLPPIPAMVGGEDPRIVGIPSELRDPSSRDKVAIPPNSDGLPGKLLIHTSKVSMSRSRLRGRHKVAFVSGSSYIGSMPVEELDVHSPYAERLYGECSLDALEQYKQNDRGRLARSPMTRAVERFISHQFRVYAQKFEALDRHRYGQEEKDEVSRINEALDNWKNQFLSEYMQGVWGPGGIGPPPPPPPLPSGTPSVIDIRLSHRCAGLGVAFRPTIRFFDEEGRHIRATPFRWISDDTNVALVDEDVQIVSTFSLGRTSIYAETLDGSLTSNRVPLEVVNIAGIALTPTTVTLGVGSRVRVEALCTLADGTPAPGVYLSWLESDPSVARVSSSGMVYGFGPGSTEIVAGDDRCLADTPVQVTVLEGPGRGTGRQHGKGFPVVLVSGIDRDPDTGEEVDFSKDDPPVHQRPIDVERNLWWINSSSPLARMYLSKDRGYGYKSQAWRMYHLERLVDVIVQIALIQAPRDIDVLSVNEWVVQWGEQEAEIHRAAAADLAGFIRSGELPS